ncbi:unnamed protein product [Cuscuta campestris]|uniref:soluble epoxide hydrolase n=1 Tax=Cuscuta campestris TaxID=132261 RepID=A0A484KQX0_9ASTE|nr:unnamed protein product [Cuscuta campestris]
MEGIKHSIVKVNGINMHVAEKGQGGGGGQVVLFLHGFPELWYSWRHQLHHFAALGYRAVAPDLRGFGDTDTPDDVSAYTCLHVVGDLVELVRSLGADKVLLVGHDWGAIIGWYFCLFRPDVVAAFVCISVPFRQRHPAVKPVEGMKALFGEDYYVCRFQEPGEIESEIARHGSEKVMRKIFTDRSPGPACLPKENPFQISTDEPELPSWLSEQDLRYFASKYGDAKGFTGGLNYYRAFNLNWELTAAWTGAQVRVPVKFMVGSVDLVYTTPGVKEYVHNGLKRDVPLLQEVVVIHGAAHFLNQERPHEVNHHIHDFFKNF